jgi:SAM-dependent methyltransferase
MNEATVRALSAINTSFYEEHADAFRSKRTVPWQGWEQLRPLFRPPVGGPPLRVLDVGSGHGRFAEFLATALPADRVSWWGIDASQPLLDHVRDPGLAEMRTLRVDFVLDPEALPGERFDRVVLFGVLHGVPSAARRLALLQACARRLAPSGRLVFTTWRFQEDARARARALPWNVYSSRAPMPIDCSQLEPGDVLLPWGDGDEVVRYVHAFDEHEIETCLAGLDLALERRFRADGRAGDQNEYFVLRRSLPEDGDASSA